MSTAPGAGSAREKAGTVLQFFWEATEHELREDLEEDEAELEEAYTALAEEAPEDATVATGLALFRLGQLRAHLNGVSGSTEDHFEHPFQPPGTLAEDDDEGRALADGVLRATRQALSLQEADNLAVFARACALHWVGEHEAAAGAYREALRLDPHDRTARARVEQLGGTQLPEPPPSLGTHHPYGFHLLEMTHVAGHSGSTEGWVGLLNDAASVRHMAERRLEAWAAGRGAGHDESFLLWTHRPGAGYTGADLAAELQQTAEGRPFIDWSRLRLDDPGDPRLPAGHPVRWFGELHFYGQTEHDDLGGLDAAPSGGLPVAHGEP